MRLIKNNYYLLGGVVILTFANSVFASSLADDIQQILNSSSMTARLVEIFMLITILGLAPSILIMVTSFVRISIV